MPTAEEILFGKAPVMGEPAAGSFRKVPTAEEFLFGAPPTPPPEEEGEFSKGLSRGLSQTKGLISGGLAAGAEVLGFDEFAESRLQDYGRYMKEAEEAGPAVGRVEDIHTLGDGMKYMAGLLGEQLPVIAGFIATGGIGGLVGKAVGKKLITEATGELLKKKLSQAATRGAATGAFGYGATLGAGEVRGEQEEAELEAEPLLALGAGSLIGALDILPIGLAVRTFGLGKQFTNAFMRRVVELPRAKRAAAIAGLVGGAEASTEAAQEVIAISARDLIDENFEALGPEGRSRILNAAAAGGFVGTVFGGAGGVVSRGRVPVGEEGSGLEGLGLPQEERREIQLEEEGREEIKEGIEGVLEKRPRKGIAQGDLFAGPIAQEVIEGASQRIAARESEENFFRALDYVKDEIALESMQGQVQQLELELKTGLPQREAVQEQLAPRAFSRVGTYTDPSGLIIIGQAGKLNPTLGLRENVVDMAPEAMTLADQALRKEVVQQRIRALRDSIPALPEEKEITLAVVEALRGREARVLRRAERGFVVRKRPKEIGESVSEEREVQLQKTVEEIAKKNEPLKPSAVPPEVAVSLQEEGINVAQLSENEQRRLYRLMEKEADGTLSDRNFQLLEVLLRKGRDKQSREAKSLDEEIQIAEQARSEESVRLAKRTGPVKPPIPIEEVREEVARFQKAYPSAPEIVVMDRIPPEGVTTPSGGHIPPLKFLTGLGFVHPKDPQVVYLNGILFTDRQTVQKVLLHESLVHSGFRRMMPWREQKQFLKLVARDLNIDVIRRRYHRELAAVKEEHRDLLAAEEYVARLAETHENLPLLKRIIAWFRRQIRRFAPRLKLTENEVRLMLTEVDLAMRSKTFGTQGFVGPSGVFQSKLETETAAFREWFGRSKVTNSDGTPREMYHGTFRQGNFEVFDPNASDFSKRGIISFTPDPNVAATYAGMPGTSMSETSLEDFNNQIHYSDRPAPGPIYPVYLRAENPFDGRKPLHFARFERWIRKGNNLEKAFGSRLLGESREARIKRLLNEAKNVQWWAVEVPDFLRENGYDSVITREHGAENIHVLDPNQVKSAIGNVGTWSRESDSILAAKSWEAGTVYSALADVGMEEEGTRAVAAIDNLGSLWKAKAMRMFLTPLQISKRINLGPFTRYLKHVEQYWATKNTLLVQAEEVYTKWRKLGKEDANKLAKVIFEISTESDLAGARLPDAEVRARIEREGLSKGAIEVYFSMDQTFRSLLDRMERGMIFSAVRRFTDMTPQQAREFTQQWLNKTGPGRAGLLEQLGETNVFIGSELQKISKQIEMLKNRNYFPRSRFGRFTILATANRDMEYDGRKVKKGEAVLFETSETERTRNSRLEEVQKEFRGMDVRIQRGRLNDSMFSFMSMPPSLMDSIQKDLGLSEGQQEALKGIFLRYAPGRSFLNHLKRRKGTAGFSQDAIRVFAAYMQNAANHIARVEHHADMQFEIEGMERLAKLQDPNTGEPLNTLDMDGTVVGEFRDYIVRHFEYLMNPGNDWAGLRAAGFMYYLGFNVKSAFVNATQVPMVTYPYLSARYGDASSIAEITKAFKSALDLVRGKGDVTEEEAIALEKAKKAGFIDESLPTEIAGIAESPSLFRILPESEGSRIINKASYYGSFLFQQAEKFNRRVAFLAAYRLAKKTGQSTEEAYEAGKDSVQTTQFEYAKWNRAEFMRGKKSVLFLFWQYMQHAAFLAFGGAGQKEALRYWMMMILLAGIQGLPFAENAFDLFDFGAQKMKKILGIKGDARSDIRGDIRELAGAIGANPDLVAHGLGRFYGLGPLHLLEMLGAPVPNVDVSGSLSLGRFIPGIEDLAGQERDPDRRLGRAVVEIGGPVLGIGYNFWRFATDTNPDLWKRWERIMPNAAKAVSKAARYQVREKETLSSGATLIDFPEDMPSRAEAEAMKITQFLGFTPTAVSQRYERRASTEEAKRFYLTQRQLLLQDLGYASIVKDREGIADARKAIRDYNRESPRPELRITSDDIERSLRSRREAARLAERGTPREKRLRRLAREVQNQYGPVVGEQ